MKIVNTIEDMASIAGAHRARSNQIGLVPTMGSFHAGHLSLIRRARAECDVVVVSIFVNPLQFDDEHDFDSYPRNFDADSSIALKEGVDYLFSPSPIDMFGSDPLTRVVVGGISSGMCGPFRPGHFEGVATTCCKLLNVVGPCFAYFGEKDAQQLAVVRHMVQDLSLPVEVVACPTVRDENGLALSSRNALLGSRERLAAEVIPRALEAAREHVQLGGRSAQEIRELVRQHFAREPLAQLQYVAVVDVETLEEVQDIKGQVLVAVAALFGKTRLIDNVVVEAD